ncbi:MAG: hypothetical protein KDM91_22535 [Verrucomicrobiae bacterium]|nr:hypothetical protein [Verrucomicrobiae bacterium]
MKLDPDLLRPVLVAAACGQLAIAMINLRLDRLLGWRAELDTLSLLLREVFFIHKWFITITLVIFGVVTLRFAGEFAAGTNALGRWLAAGIGLFWAIRTGVQWLYYDWSHWRGKAGRTAIHWTLTICYGGCAAAYLAAAFG